MQKSEIRFVCSVLSLLICSVPATAQEYWNYKTAYLAYDRGDFTLAADMYKRLAADGHMRAQNDLAFLYEVGQGVSQDRQKAAALYLRAAEQGYGPAQHRVAGLYLTGKSFGRDDLEAHKWFSLASLLNRDEGHRALSSNRQAALEARLTGLQLAAARKRACDWWQLFIKPGPVNKEFPKPLPVFSGCDLE